MLITLSQKNRPHLGKLHAYSGRDTLSLRPLGHRGSKIRPEGADHLTLLVALSDGSVVLLADRAALQAESFCSLVQLVSFPVQPGDLLGVLISPLLQGRGPFIGFQLEVLLPLQLFQELDGPLASLGILLE